MKLARFGAPGNEKSGLIDAKGKLRDLSHHVSDITNRHLSDEALARIASIETSLRSQFGLVPRSPHPEKSYA